MPKRNSTSEKDMFGQPAKKRIDRHEKLLARIDKQTFARRLKGLKFVESITGNLSLMGSMEAVFVFQEAGWSYINGSYISTIMLAQASIERHLYDFMVEKGLEIEAKRGAQAIIKYCRKHQLINEFLLAKFDRLRQIRNPFVHVKPMDHPFALGQRIFFEKAQPDELIEKDAKEALSLMYTILFTRL